jgi:hypothetical protein
MLSDYIAADATGSDQDELTACSPTKQYPALRRRHWDPVKLIGDLLRARAARDIIVLPDA